MSEVTMPRLSDSMEEGTILTWLKASGDEVAVGDELAEVETDKATMTYEAEDAGTLAIVAEAGSTVAVGGLIATIGAVTAARPAAPPAAAPAAPPAAAAPPASAAAAAPAAAPAPAGNGRAKASPVARRLAAEFGVDLARIVGTGPRGRIVKTDVIAARDAAPVAPPAPAEPVAPPAPAEPVAPAAPEAPGGRGAAAEQPLTRVQQLIARRMAEAKATIPEFTVEAEVAMDAAVELRASLKAALGDDAPTPSYNDMVVKAVAAALRAFPRVNASYRDGAFVLHERVNVGVAVAAEDALVVPTVFDADRLSLGAIARRTRELARAVREGSVAPPDLAGGTFTVSNLGMLGADRFTAVINPPQAAILAVGSLAQRPVVRDGQLAVGHTLRLTLTCDHRILYGADGARFLSCVRDVLERPLMLAVS